MPVFIADTIYIRPRQHVSLSGSIIEFASVYAALDAENHLSLSALIASIDRVASNVSIVNAGTYVLNVTSIDRVTSDVQIGSVVDDILMFEIFNLDPLQAINSLSVQVSANQILATGIQPITAILTTDHVSSYASIGGIVAAISTTDRVLSTVDIIDTDDVLMFSVFNVDPLQGINTLYIEEFI